MISIITPQSVQFLRHQLRHRPPSRSYRILPHLAESRKQNRQRDCGFQTLHQFYEYKYLNTAYYRFMEFTYLEKKSDPVGVVIHCEVCEPGSSIGVNNDLITAFQGDENVCSSHRVFMVILIKISSSEINNVRLEQPITTWSSYAYNEIQLNTL